MVFFISGFAVSLASSINRPDFSSDGTVLIRSFIQKNVVNPILALEALFPLAFLPVLSIAFEDEFKVKLLTNPGKVSKVDCYFTFTHLLT